MGRKPRISVPADHAQISLVLTKEILYSAQLHSHRTGHLTLESYLTKLIVEDMAKTPVLPLGETLKKEKK